MITPAQLKATNQIFNDHFNTKVELGLVRQQLDSYKVLYKDELEIDSLYEATISQLKATIYDYDYKVKEQEIKLNSTKQKLKGWRICGISVSLALLLYVCITN